MRQPPDVVRRAHAVAREQGFQQSCSDETGWLLRTLAAGLPPGARIGESGTGCGVGASWILAGARDARLVTVERDPGRAAAARALFALDEEAQASNTVTVLEDDWTALRHHGPFDLFFCDGGGKTTDPDGVVGLVAEGGTLVLDDFAPSASWPPVHDDRPDRLRLCYLDHPELVATELRVSAGEAVVLGRRRAPGARRGVPAGRG